MNKNDPAYPVQIDNDVDCENYGLSKHEKLAMELFVKVYKQSSNDAVHRFAAEYAIDAADIFFSEYDKSKEKK